jgi:neutral ceramidase
MKTEFKRSDQTHKLVVGAARRTINPEAGHRLCGYGPDYPNEGVHDDISATALFLDDGARQAVLINFDLLGLMGADIASIRAAAAKSACVPVGHVFLACTHVHSGPYAFLSRQEPEPRAAGYLERLHGWAADAAAEARGNAEPCELRYNFAYVDANMNRRYGFPDRRFLYIPANKQLAGQSTEFVDREVGIVAFRKVGTHNRYKAIVTNYTAHPLCVGNSSLLVSADYQGVLRRHVEETFSGCLCLSTTGAAGDNHPLLPEAGFAAAEDMGARLARTVIARCYDAVSADYDTQLRMAYPAVTLKAADAATRQMLPELEARKRKVERGAPLRKTWVSLLGIGPILLAGFPGEPVSELGAMLKWSSPFLKTYTLFTATDLLAYFPTANQFYWGGFEPNGCPFACGSGERLVAQILKAAGQLIRERPLVLPPLNTVGTD